MLKRLFKWILKSEINDLKQEISRAQAVSGHLEKRKKVFDILLEGIDVSVDVQDYRRASSWAVISLQGQRSDFVKFVDLGDKDIEEIQYFLRRYGLVRNIKVDASPSASGYLRARRSRTY